MHFLLDTHIFLWFVLNEPKLSARVSHLIADPSHEIWVSMASLWEMAIKSSSGKLKLMPDFVGFVATHIPLNNFQVLPIEQTHLFEVAHLPFHHRDPFDRLLLAQSLVESMPILSADGIFDDYGVQQIF